MDNNMYAKPMYKCAVCGEIYDSIAQRMNCEQTCLKNKEEEERKAAEAKKAAEYDIRVAEVKAAFDKAYDLRDKFVYDYGKFHYNRRSNSNYNFEDVLNLLLEF